MVVGDLPTVGALPHMCRVTQSVYAALLRAHVEEQGWGDVVSNQVTIRDCRSPESSTTRVFSYHGEPN